MKKGYKKLLVLSSILIVLLLLDIFMFNFFSTYKMILFVIGLIVFFHIFFVLEKDRHRYLKEILYEMLLFIISFFLLYYLLGLVIGLARSANYYNINGLINFIIPTILYTIAREFFRYNMLNKADESKITTVVVVIVFILLDMAYTINNINPNTSSEALRLVCVTILPIISRNIAYSYITKRLGYKPVITFDLIFGLFPYFIPIVPNPSEYLVAIIQLVVPILFAFKILNFVEKKADKRVTSDYYKRRFRGAIIPALIILALVYFYSGYFRFQVVAIASGSMTPQILKGDVVVVDKSYDFDNLEEGQIIAYRREKIIVVHRIVKKVKLSNEVIYYTKGDFNDFIDDIIIERDMVVGVVDLKIPYVGYPTVWLSER